MSLSLIAKATKKHLSGHVPKFATPQLLRLSVLADFQNVRISLDKVLPARAVNKKCT